MLSTTRSRWLLNGRSLITAVIVSIILRWGCRQIGGQGDASMHELQRRPSQLLPGSTLATDATFFTYDSSELISVRVGLAGSLPCHRWAICPWVTAAQQPRLGDRSLLSLHLINIHFFCLSYLEPSVSAAWSLLWAGTMLKSDHQGRCKENAAPREGWGRVGGLLRTGESHDPLL